MLTEWIRKKVKDYKGCATEGRESFLPINGFERGLADPNLPPLVNIGAFVGTVIQSAEWARSRPFLFTIRSESEALATTSIPDMLASILTLMERSGFVFKAIVVKDFSNVRWIDSDKEGNKTANGILLVLVDMIVFLKKSDEL